MVVLNNLRRAVISRDRKVWIKLYTTYVRPLLEFSALTVSPRHKTYIEMLEKVQNRATKEMSTIGKLTPAERNKFCRLPSIEDRKKFAISTETYLILHGISGISTHIVSKIEHTANIRAATQDMLALNRPKSETTANVFRTKAPTLWNKLPLDIRTAPSLDCFKSAYQVYV